MIITLVKADFSANNIGTLSSFNILTNLGNGCTYNGPLYVTKNGSLNTSITVSSAYTFDISQCTITMAGVNVTNAFTVNENTISINISNVTGHVLITVPTTLATTTPDTPEGPDQPIVDPDEPEVDYNGTLVTFEIPPEGTWLKNENGSEQSLREWFSTDYIEIPHNVTTISSPDIIYFRNGTNNTTPFAFYNDNKSYLGGVSNFDTTDGNWWRGMIQDYTIPAGAKYVRICWTNQTVPAHAITGSHTPITKPEVYWGSMPEDKIPMPPHLETINGELIDLGVLTDKQWIDMRGNNNTLNNWKSTDYIEIPETASAMSTNDITSYRNGSANVGTFVFYDANKNFISCVNTEIIPIGTSSGNWRDQILNYPIPENAKYVRICYTVEHFTHAVTNSTTPISELKVYWITQ